MKWISFDPVFRLFVIRPNKTTPLDYTRIRVILDDSKTQNVYNLSLWILESSEEADGSEDSKTDEPIEPEPVDPKPDDSKDEEKDKDDEKQDDKEPTKSPVVKP